MGEILVTDWPGTGAMLQGIGTILGAIAVAYAAWLGSNTFKSWKQQKLAERKIEQAERILTATYRVRQGLSRVRNIGMLNHELNAGEAQLKETGEWDKALDESHRNRMATAQAYYNRLNATKDDSVSLVQCQPMAHAFFGDELEKAIEKLNHQLWTVKVYVDANYRDSEGYDRPLRDKIDSTIYEGYPSADENEMDRTIASQVKRSKISAYLFYAWRTTVNNRTNFTTKPQLRLGGY